MSILFVYGCSDTEFVAERTDKKKSVVETPEKPETEDVVTAEPKLVDVSCDKVINDVYSQDVTAPKGQKIKVSGNICYTPKIENVTSKLTVMLVNDVSDSMQENDPLTNGSCGRYQAISSIIEKLKALMTDQVEINVGILNFASYGQTLLEMTNIKNLQSLPVNEICDHYAQTNYEDALGKASRILSQYDGNRALYFITDGLPTQSNSSGDHRQRGLEAAENLRFSISDLVFYSIYLESKEERSVFSPDPAQYLSKVTGKSENVKLVKDAASLATEIAKFELPEPQDTQLSKPSLSLEFDGQKKDIAVESFKRVSDGVWKFETEDFLPYQKEGEYAENLLTVSYKVEDNVSKTMEIRINYSERK